MVPSTSARTIGSGSFNNSFWSGNFSYYFFSVIFFSNFFSHTVSISI